MNIISTTKRWYAVASQPSREAIAANQLDSQDFDTFFPKRVRTVRHARRTKNRIVSYFPGYLFVALDLNVDRWRSVNGTFGVRSLVMAGDRPLPVPAGLVDSLRTLTDENGFLRRVDELRTGDHVRVMNGPLADMIGAIDRVDGNQRVRILIDMLHGQIPAVIDRENVMKTTIRQPSNEPSRKTPKSPGVR